MKQWKTRRGTQAVLNEMAAAAEDLDIESGEKERLVNAMEELLRALRSCNFTDGTDPSLLQVKLTADSAELIERWRAEKDEMRDVCSVHQTCPCMCCWDETDDGVPPFCRTMAGHEDEPVQWWKVFNGDNGCTNRSTACWLFGTIGFKVLDKRRRVFMGIAMWTTLISMLFTFVGALAYSTNHNLLYTVRWFEYSIVNTTNPDASIVAYMGLRSIMVTEEPCNPVTWCQETT